ncbi:MAG: sodium/solute symporter [Planctomycetes bacterium]|nr:sodium/solute symporter [Planctomycetota bacterium]
MPPQLFMPMDWAVLILYLSLSAGLGLFLSGKNNSFSDFMFGAGKVPWYAVGISLIATSVSATSFLGNPAESYQNDMRFLMNQFGALISIVIVGFVFIPKFRNAKVQSAYEILEQRFSKGIRLLASILYCGHLLLRTGLLIYGPSLVLAQMLQISVSLAIILTSSLAIIYTCLGGIRAVIWTDFIQFIILIGGGILTLYYISSLSDLNITSMIEQATLAGKTRSFDFIFDPTDARCFLSAGLVYIIFEVAIRGCDQQFVQRYLSCNSIKEANYSAILSVILGFAVSLIFYYVGAFLFVYYSTGPGVLPEKIDINAIFPHFILHQLPQGLRGLLVAAIYAAAMSSLDSAVSALSNTTIVDLLGYQNNSPEKKLKMAKVWVIIWGILGTGAAFFCAVGQKSILAKALFFTSLFTGPLLALFVLAFFSKRLNSRSLFFGVIFGILTLLAFSELPFENFAIWGKVIHFDTFPLYKFSWPWNPLISLLGTLMGAYLFALTPYGVKTHENNLN